MRNTFSFLAALVIVGALASGCANTERKFGRGMSNFGEVARGGELRRTVEETAVLQSPDAGYTVGFVRGIDRSVARTGVGLYEIITFPFPPYHPIFTRYLAPEPVYPDNYKPDLISDSMFDTDTYIGYGGGDVAPFVPGSRFQVFNDN